MELSLFLAQVMGIVFLVVGLALVLRPAHYMKAYKEWLKDDGLLLFTAMVMLPAGAALVITHNVWVWNWPVLITIVGWGIIIKGVFISFLPKEFNKLVDGLMKMKWLIIVGGLIWVIGGLVLGYFGWFA